MKICKILHIHDGKPSTDANGNFLFIESYPGAQAVLDSYLKDGWEVKQVVPHITPIPLSRDDCSFYNSGFIIYLEKEE